MSDFVKTFSDLSRKQEQLDEELAPNRKEAIKYIQNIFDQFGIKAKEVHFRDSVETEEKPRMTTKIKYKLPNGVTWTGKGHMKREVKEYLEENGLTKEDLVHFLVE